MNVKKAALALTVVASGVLLFVTPAFAHVTLEQTSEPQGGSDITLTFRVPNEEDKANVTQLDIAFPTDHPIASALVERIPGWTSDIKTTHLSTPIHTDDGNISTVVSEVIWTASSASSQIAPGGFQTFPVLAGALPDNTDSLEFKAIQTYSNGDVVRWIEDTPKNGPEPEHPAPVLRLTKATSNNVSATTSSKDSTARTLSYISLGIAIIGLLFALGAFVRRRA